MSIQNDPSSALMYRICHPLAQAADPNEAPSKEIEFGTYLSRPMPSEVPESAKQLLAETEFINSAQELEKALSGPKQHVVWQPNARLLLHWQREEHALWSLTIFCQPSPSTETLPGFAGGIATLFSMLRSYMGSWEQQLSEWTSNLKTRVDPIGLAYAPLPREIFSESWAQALEKGEWIQLFLPLEGHRLSPPLLPCEEQGYLQRFMTPSRRPDDAGWLYKAWMRHKLPREEYKKCYFLIRWSLFQGRIDECGETQRPTDREIASKLMRSLLKQRFDADPSIQKRLQEYIVKEGAKPRPSASASPRSFMPPLVPTQTVSQPVVPLQPPPPAAPLPNEPPPTRLPYLWHEHKDPAPPGTLEENDPRWDLSQCPQRDRVSRVFELERHGQLLHIQSSSPVESYKRLLIFKRLIAQIDSELAERLFLIPHEDLTAGRFWEERESHEAWLRYHDPLMPKNRPFMLVPTDYGKPLPHHPGLAKLFLCTLDHQSEEELPEGYAEAFTRLLSGGTDPESSKKCNSLRTQFPNTYKFLSLLKNFGVGRRSIHAVDPSCYLAESSLTRGECYDPLNTPMSVIREALPRLAPFQALINFRQLHPHWKYKRFAAEDLFRSFFQEAWLTEELKKRSAPGWLGQESQIEPELLLEARARGRLPWVEALKKPEFQRFLEQFLSEEYALLTERLESLSEGGEAYGDEFYRTTRLFLLLLRLSILCLRECRDLRLPPFEKVLPLCLKVHETGPDRPDEIFRSPLRNLKTVKLYLFWLHAEQGREASAYRPLESTLFLARWSPDCAEERWLEIDRPRILAHLQRLPDFPADEPRLDPFPLNRVHHASPDDLPSPPPEEPASAQPNLPTHRVHTLETRWWSGEPIDLVQPLSSSSKYPPDDWKLRERPHLFWRAAAPGQLHGNELVDTASGETAAHVFHVDLGEGPCSFSIPCKGGAYSPNTLEEQLCLLLHFGQASNLSAQWNLIQQLPHLTHKLSPTALQLMQRIAASAAARPERFENLGLAVHILARFQNWVDNPTLRLPPVATLSLTQASMALWELYRNVQQNVNQEHLLTNTQRRDLSSLFVRTIKKEGAKQIEESGLPKKAAEVLLTPLKRQSPSSTHLAWHRSIRLSPLETQPRFDQEEEAVIEERYPRSSFFWSDLKSLALRSLCIFARLLGSRHIWKERIASIQAQLSPEFEAWIPKEGIGREEALRRRMELAAFRTTPPASERQYLLELSDWALANDLIARREESAAEFLARVEVCKHVRGLLRGVVDVLCSAWRTLGEWYRLIPHSVSFEVDGVRNPFELFGAARGVSSAPKEERMPPEEILKAANKSSPETRIQLAAAQQEPIQWAHLEGLFVQNQMRRLRQINPALTDGECDQIDAWVRSALIDPAQRYLYNPYEKHSAVRALLVFEKTTGMTVREKQLEKLKVLFTRGEDGRYRNLALQMDMGEGKTSVLASIVLLEAAVPGRISLYVPPAAQYESMAAMLPKWQKERYRQEVVPIHIPFELMQTASVLEWLRGRLLDAKEQGHVLLVHPATLHYLRLAWLSSKDPELQTLLFAIRKELREHADLLLDEIDQVADPYKDTSLAHGADKEPSMRQLRQFESLVRRHQADPLIWEALCSNAPEKLDPAHYASFCQTNLAPALAAFFDIPEPHRESFCRYLVGKATRAEDASFLTWLSTDDRRDEIAQHKNWLEDILPFTPFRERGRHFGRNGSQAAVVPYAGVGAPSPTTKFATLGEEISYYWWTALSSPLDLPKFDEVFSTFKSRFERYRTQGNRPAQDQVSKEFHEMTGCSLQTAIHRRAEQEQALRNVNRDPLLRLKCEVYLARAHVKYFEWQFTSTSQHFMSLFNTHRGFSGTFPGYLYAFDHVVVPDSGSDQSVIDAMLEHDEEVLQLEKAETLFAHFKDESKMGGLIDAGGLFREFSNEQIARQALSELPHIQSVLFFGKSAPSDHAPDTPMLMQRTEGGPVIHKLGSTEAQLLEAWGVELESLFLVCDERHCEATNVIQRPDRLNAITVGLRSTKRDLLQGVMRARNYKGKDGQRVVYVMQPKTAERLFGTEAPHAQRILEASKSNEREETGKRSHRTYFHRIDAAFCNAVEDYMASSIHRPKQCDALRRFLLHCLNDPSPYRQFGGISEECSSVDQLKEYLSTKQKAFAKIYPGPLPESLTRELQAIERLLPNDPHLPKKSISRRGTHLGQEQQQQVRQRIQQEQQREQQTERLLPTPATGRPWTEVCEFRSIRLSDHYGSLYNRCYLVSRTFEAKLFEGLLASENFLHTYQTAYPLNHPDQKRANYVRLERSGGRLRATILSGYDYHNYYTQVRTLPAHSSICFWRPSKEGGTHYLQGSLRLTLEEEAQWKRIRLQIAFLNGDVSYVVDHLSDLPTPLEETHLTFLRKRVEYWEVFREREEWWWVWHRLCREFGAGAIFASNLSYWGDGIWADQQGRSCGQIYDKPEKREALDLIRLLEEPEQ